MRVIILKLVDTALQTMDQLKPPTILPDTTVRRSAVD